jgi:hypothetical protein
MGVVDAQAGSEKRKSDKGKYNFRKPFFSGLGK